MSKKRVLDGFLQKIHIYKMHRERDLPNEDGEGVVRDAEENQNKTLSMSSIDQLVNSVSFL